MEHICEIRRGLLYFIDEKLASLCPDVGLMDISKGPMRDRPCLCVGTNSTGIIFWMVPISSRVEKYKGIYNHKIDIRGVCDSIVFGRVAGNERAFLIQNLFPVTPQYINGVYNESKRIPEKAGDPQCSFVLTPILIEQDLLKEIISKTNKILSLERLGKKIVFTDINQMLFKMEVLQEKYCEPEYAR